MNKNDYLWLKKQTILMNQSTKASLGTKYLHHMYNTEEGSTKLALK
jgi:hypothetical protein